MTAATAASLPPRARPRFSPPSSTPSTASRAARIRAGDQALRPPPRLPDARDRALDLGVRALDHEERDAERPGQHVRPPARLRRARRRRDASCRGDSAELDAEGALAAL